MAAPSENSGAGFRRIAVLGTGLIGGSFALAVRQSFPDVHIVGWDRSEVLHRAQERGAIQEGFTDLARALAGADLVYVALPVGHTLELLPEIARRAAANALVTDAASTKARVCRLAAESFRGSAGFLGGHPMAGKETSGIEAADADLFRGAKYVLIGEASAAAPRERQFAALVADLGAQPVWMDAETHDWAVAIVSHLPQMLAVALAGVVDEEMDETGMPAALAGRGLRDMLRLAGSPYSIWRDISLTNTTNIARALDRVSQAIEDLRTRLRSRELESEFTRANEVYKILRELK
jgi:prephenate dehydrogenase